MTARLTGKYVIDQALAKGSFRPLYQADGSVNEAECGLYCRPDQIAACAWSTDIVGTVTPEAAAQTGLATGTPVITGTGDSTAEAISVGLVVFQIVERFTAIPADRGGDHRDLAVVRRDQTADRTSFLQRRQMAILRPVSNQDIQSAKNNHIHAVDHRQV